MLLPALSLLFQIAAGAPPAQPTVYSGRDGQLDVRIPHLADTVVVDGQLDEPAWRQAAVLTGFSLYQPIDSRPAPDSTEVLVWYSDNAIHFGIRAFEPHGIVRATLADRDRISSDDNVEIHLDTFHDLRRAFVFIVNPLGVQADGTKSEGGGFIPGANIMPGQNDLSADFLWDSRGHVTDWGYEVEVRIRFKTLRYPMSMPQTWGVQVVRNVQHSGYQQTWTPAKRANASFIVQEGRLVGLAGMRHGQVVELNPELTTTVAGDTIPAGRGWSYESKPSLGGNVKWGLGSNFVLNGTVKPDFSQVEADALQIATDPRFALFYAEKRPFFVEGSEQFNVPNILVYTRRIVQPRAAAKLTGRVGENDVAFLSAVDDPLASHSGQDKPVVSIVRLRRDFLGQSTMGLLLSDRTEGPSFNRVAGGDVRVVFGRLYFAQLQMVGSATRFGGPTREGPMWEAVVDRTGRAFGFHYAFLGIDPRFDAWNGFVPRTGFVQPSIANRFTLYGAPGRAFERYNVFVRMIGLWRYADFWDGKPLLEDQLTVTQDFTFRGGWGIGVNPAIASYAFDPAAYSRLYVPTSGGPVPFTTSARRPVAVLGLKVTTPQFRHFAATAGASRSRDVDFAETSPITRTDVNASVDWRPTGRARVNGSYLSSVFERVDGGERTLARRIPRLKLEYQISRPVFVRFVGQYDSQERAALRDPLTGETLLVQTRSGLVPSTATTRRELRADWLFSYRPNPGTVFFLGYGSSLERDDDRVLTHDFQRQNDAFFVKLSYLFRL